MVKESPVYASGGFVDTYNTGIQYSPAGRATGERYRYLDDGQGTSEKYQYIEDSSYQTVSSRYSGERTMLYAHGSPVAINRSSGTRGYLGTDILGSTRSVTDNHGVQEFYYDYDIFGSPITGNYTTGADYGYLGKPYDSITGLYNYGYRDYSPQTVRFTTVDPIRDGANWFTYVNNDPVNYVDLWGLLASDGGRTVPNTWRDNKDGTYTALPGATLYELYGENWREESGYVGNPSNLQVGDVVGRKSSFMENSVSQPIVNSKQEVLVIDNSFPQVTNSEEIFEGYSHRTNIAIGVTEIVLGVGIIVSSTITAGTINVVSGGMTTIPAGWAIIEGWAAGSTFIALGITRLSNANNSRVSDDIKQVFIPSVVDVAEGIDDVSKGQEQ